MRNASAGVFKSDITIRQDYFVSQINFSEALAGRVVATFSPARFGGLVLSMGPVAWPCQPLRVERAGSAL